MTDADWLAVQELEMAEVRLELAKERVLGQWRRKRVVTQRELQNLVEMWRTWRTSGSVGKRLWRRSWAMGRRSTCFRCGVWKRRWKGVRK